MAEFCEKNGGNVVLFEDYQYVKIRQYKSDVWYCRCTNYKKLKCTGSINIKGESIVIGKEHKCLKDVSKNILLKEKNTLKITAAKTDIPIPKIYKEAKKCMHDQGLDFVIGKITKFSNIKSQLYNARLKAIGAKKTVLKNFKEVQVPKKFDDLLLCEYDDAKTRIILFCSKESRSLIGKTKEFFVDATFHSCPKPFYQLLSVHVDFGSTEFKVNTRPLIYILMPDKKQNTYTRVFQMIKSRLPELDIGILHCDFEIGLWNAALEVYPQGNIKGCYAHWNRNIWRKAKKLGHKTRDEKRIVGLCAILALLPKNLILEGWEYISSEYASINISMPKFMAYVGRLLNKQKRNQFDSLSVFGLRHRNNVLESYHSSLNKVLNKNVTILRLLNVLVDNETFTETEEPKNRKKESVIRDDAIRHTIMQCLTGEITIGHTLEKLR